MSCISAARKYLIRDVRLSDFENFMANWPLTTGLDVTADLIQHQTGYQDVVQTVHVLAKLRDLEYENIERRHQIGWRQDKKQKVKT